MMSPPPAVTHVHKRRFTLKALICVCVNQQSHKFNAYRSERETNIYKVTPQRVAAACLHDEKCCFHSRVNQSVTQ